ncbi:MAG: RNA helicase required for poly(A+) mRNA export [Cirrosporium novae-zelandiae]|nr:MAG: RNA helicase required for poly(A+) mRNA export [Cirrosporium novae-zelandiae]
MSTSETTTPKPGGSLADRITKPSDPSTAPEGTKPSTDPSKVPESTKPSSDLTIAQQDGAADGQGGSGLHEPEYEVDVKLSDLQANADPNNPLYSIKSFKDLGLDEALLRGLINMNINRPSKIQEKALPLLLVDPPQNLIGQSQSGTGKTAAFTLNILSRIDFSPEMANVPQALCLAPSRELARQIVGVIELMGCFIHGLRVQSAIPRATSARGTKLEGQIIVGTPGTTMDLIKKRLLDASKIKILVLDEADNMLDQQGLGDQCMRVKSMIPKQIQIVLFSATFPDRVVDYARRFAPNANQLTLRHEELTVEGIKQLYIDCQNDQDKYETLVRLYGLLTIGSSIIFVQRRDTALEIEKRMTKEGHQVACLTGGFEGVQRDEVIDSFRNGSAKVLITTNVLARGIDVSTVSMVINYDIPIGQRGEPDAQTYLHRIGRTGRFGRVGVSISFVHDKTSWMALKKIAEYFSVQITRLETDDWDNVEDTIKEVIKSSRAGQNFQVGSRNPSGDNEM